MRLLGIFLFISLSYGCEKNAGCTQFGTDNYDPAAVFDDGSCILAREKFVGQFNVGSDCISSDYTRTIEITSGQFVVAINNIADTLGSVEARVYGNNITIDPQTIDNLITVEGAGVFAEDSTISISYRIRDQRNGVVQIYDCLETCTRL